MTREEKIELLNKLLEIEEKNDIGNLTRAERGEFQQWINDAKEQEPCEDAISRQAVLEELSKWDWQELYLPIHFKENIIDVVPSVNPQEPKTGRWIAQDIHNCHTDFKCSECGYIHNFMHLYGEPTADYSYCPNCGAKMEESEGKE